MKKLTGYMAGVNLGGWISQYRTFDHGYFKTFITEEDIKTIASWGMDHIRLPVDYPLLEEDANPGVFLESGFAYIDNCLRWTKKYGLNLLIEVHRAPGYTLNSTANTLFSDKTMQDRFVAIWKAIVRRYRGEGSNVMYELLNEVVEPDSSRWNPLAERLINAIREEDREHIIMVGGNDYNSVKELVNLTIFNDDKVIYTFHMYQPMALTHQRASYVPEAMAFNRAMSYPSDDLASYLEYLKYYVPPREPVDYQGLTRMDKKFLYSHLRSAFDFMEKHNKTLYCGEYGVITLADMPSREAWCEDVSDIFLEYGIGRSVWSYKGDLWTLIDKDRKPVSDKLIKTLSKK